MKWKTSHMKMVSHKSLYNDPTLTLSPWPCLKSTVSEAHGGKRASHGLCHVASIHHSDFSFLSVPPCCCASGFFFCLSLFWLFSTFCIPCILHGSTQMRRLCFPEHMGIWQCCTSQRISAALPHTWCPGLDRAAIGMPAQAYSNPILLVMRKNLHDIPDCHSDQPGGRTVPCALTSEPFTEPLNRMHPLLPA